MLGTLDDAGVAEALAVNLGAPVALANLFCRVFAGGAGECLLINVSSGLAERALPGSGPYSIAKAGLEMLTRQLVAEQQAPGFRAITVRPGIIDTGMQAFMRSRPREAFASVDMFKGFHASGQLVPPDVVAAKIVDRLLLSAVENGRCYSYKEL
jgi:benzil reductase ((S)-benzoin forming)